MTNRLLTVMIGGMVPALLFCSGSCEAAGELPSAGGRTPGAVAQDAGPWRRDPFIGAQNKTGTLPPARAAAPKTVNGVNGYSKPDREPDIQLQGIIYSGRTFHALINGRSVKTGDTIGGVTIREIGRYHVVVLNERKEKITYDVYQGRIDRGKQ